MSKAKGLTPKQQRFVAEYLIDLNATQAAKRAGYSARTANEQGARLLANARVQEQVAMLRKDQAAKLNLRAEGVLREVARITFSDIRKMFAEDGTLLAPKDWPDEMASAVASVKVFEEFEGKGESRKLIGYTREIKLWDKNSAADKLMKHLGLYEKDNEQKTDPLTALLDRIAKDGRLVGPARAASA